MLLFIPFPSLSFPENSISDKINKWNVIIFFMAYIFIIYKDNQKFLKIIPFKEEVYIKTTHLLYAWNYIKDQQ
jgi:hypothetical protein